MTCYNHVDSLFPPCKRVRVRAERGGTSEWVRDEWANGGGFTHVARKWWFFILFSRNLICLSSSSCNSILILYVSHFCGFFVAPLWKLQRARERGNQQQHKGGEGEEEGKFDLMQKLFSSSMVVCLVLALPSDDDDDESRVNREWSRRQGESEDEKNEMGNSAEFSLLTNFSPPSLLRLFSAQAEFHHKTSLPPPRLISLSPPSTWPDFSLLTVAPSEEKRSVAVIHQNFPLLLPHTKV